MPPPIPANDDYDQGDEPERARLIVTTGNDVTGYRIRKYLGVVRGIVVRSPNIAQGFFGGLKQIIGGNIQVYADVCETARREAYELMVEHALDMGADGIIAMRYDATEFSASVTEVLAYGTAVQLARS
ncbi:MAG TPA: YbjQ family protein [Gemmataceae bacterium]|nr:YbjQ family protein [Gemmataceae bacterium]